MILFLEIIFLDNYSCLQLQFFSCNINFIIRIFYISFFDYCFYNNEIFVFKHYFLNLNFIYFSFKVSGKKISKRFSITDKCDLKKIFLIEI